ncbi:MAG: hypothetical protein V4621_06790 [Pseudomonadota bacterium]
MTGVTLPEDAPKTVLGVICRSSYFPAFTITVLECQGKMYGLWPSGDVVRLTDDAQESPHFYRCAATMRSADVRTLTSFAFNKSAIAVGTLNELQTSLEIERTNCDLNLRNFSAGDYDYYDAIVATCESLSPTPAPVTP